MFFLNKNQNISLDPLNESINEKYNSISLFESVEVETTFFEKVKGTFFSRIDIDESNKTFTIKGIDANKLVVRMKHMYKEKRLDTMFDKKYTWWSEVMWKKRRIRKRDMEIKEITVPLFFALEVAELFNELYGTYRLRHYKYLSNEIRKKTWVGNLLDNKEIKTDLKPLKNIRYTLKDFQLEFVEQYMSLKTKSDLEGYILSFDQGLGKTLTSIALMECLKKDQIFIVCPNSLKENWSYEIKAYFEKYDDDEVWKDEVYVIGNSDYRHTKNTKYYIINQESISKMYEYTSKRSKNAIIVDESHNFRNMNAKRVKDLLILKEKLACDDVLMMSGTPIKATPNEIIPALLMIDPMFNIETAKIYNKCFDVDDTATANIVQQRFGRVIYRKTKNDVLSLPNKTEGILKFNLNNGDKYLVQNVKEITNERFEEIYGMRLRDEDELKDEFVGLVEKYSSSSKEERKKYLSWVDRNINKDHRDQLHELTQNEIDEYIDKYVRKNITNDKDQDRLDYLINNFLGMRKSSMATAIGEILPKYRKEMYIELYLKNNEEIIKMIKENPKKTVIFSTMLDVVHTIYDDLEKNGIGVVKIIGGTSKRMDKIQQFKNDDTIDVIIATSQTLSTGVTLTEANQMFFFGTPWRSADYQQACDRIHRIGQTTEVNIYKVLLDTGEELNLSTRMEVILNWSDRMFTSMIDNNSLSKLYKSDNNSF